MNKNMIQKNEKESILKQLIDHFGNESKLAKAVGIKPQSINASWRFRGVPVNRVLQIEKITGGKFARHQLRPDIYPED